MPSSWTRPGDVRAALGRKWASGALLTSFAADQDWEPLVFRLRGPAASVIGERLGEVQGWAREWEQAACGPLRVEYKKVGGRHVGANMIPCRAWIDGYDQAWALLGVAAEVGRFADLAEQTLASCPRVLGWLTRYPMRALRLHDRWDRLLATVRWIDQRQLPGMYLRQVDVPGVDTKFIEQHRSVLAELLDLQLDQDRIDPAAADFEGRYRFRGKPAYVRFRCADGSGFSELTVRTDEFTARPPGIRRAYVVENEITYLAFPCPADAVVIWGRGYAVSVLEPLAWLADTDVVYWGDIDTHGLCDPGPSPAALPTRPVDADGPDDPAGAPHPVGRGVESFDRKPGLPGHRGDGALPRPDSGCPGPVSKARTGTCQLRGDRAGDGGPPHS